MTEGVPVLPGLDEPLTMERRSLWKIARRRLVTNRTALVGMAIVILFVVATVAAHFVWPYNARIDKDYSLKLKPPTIVPNEEVPSVHPFGTDKLGRDIFRRVIHGGWNSLRVGVVSVGIALVIGGLLGLLAGFYESLEIDIGGQIILYGIIGLALGAIPAFISDQLYLMLLFLALGIAAALVELPWSRLIRVGVFAGAGFLVAGGPVWVLVHPYTAASCAVLGAIIGAILGLQLLGGVLSNIIMRLMDIILAFPGILLAIAIVAMLGPGLDKGMIAIGVVSIPAYARLMRSTVLSVINNDYIEATRALGASTGRILFRHIVPNSLSPIIVQSTLGLAGAILWAGALGFLGLGAIPPEPEWGAMLGESYRYLASGSWWAVLFPGLAIMLSVLGFNLMGDGLRDALDPRLQV